MGKKRKYPKSPANGLDTRFRFHVFRNVEQGLTLPNIEIFYLSCQVFYLSAGWCFKDSGISDIEIPHLICYDIPFFTRQEVAKFVHDREPI